MTAIPIATIAVATGTSTATLGGRSFWASTSPVVTAIQVTLITPSATIISIRPMLEPMANFVVSSRMESSF